MIYNVDDIHVVVRSVGERTTSLCVELLEESFKFKHLEVIQSKPFEATLYKSYESGINSGVPWLLCVDADVLIEPESLSKLLELRKKVPNEVFEIQGLVQDKFFPVPRPAGNHLYRSSQLETAIALVPEVGEQLRPEGFVLRQMLSRGFPWFQSDEVIGYHDFGQYYKDILRTCLLHSKKHKTLLGHVYDYWLKQSRNDMDFFVALMALSEIFHGENELTSIEDANNQFENVFEDFGLVEKSDENIRQDYKMASQIFDLGGFETLRSIMTPPHSLNQVATMATPKKSSTTARVRSRLNNLFGK